MLAITASDVLDATDWLAFNEIRHRNQSLACWDAHIVQRVEATTLNRIADTNVYRVIHVIWSIFTHEYAIRDELHGHSDESYVRIENRGASSVDSNTPLHPWDRSRVFHIAQSLNFVVDVFADCGHDRRNKLPIVGRELKLNRLSDGWTFLKRANFNYDANQVFHSVAHHF